MIAIDLEISEEREDITYVYGDIYYNGFFDPSIEGSKNAETLS